MHHPDDLNCFIRANHMSNSDFVFLYDSMEHLKSFDATLIGHENEGWGTTPIMPKDETTNRSFNVQSTRKVLTGKRQKFKKTPDKEFLS